MPVHSNKVGKVVFVVINGLHNQTTPKHSKTTNRQHTFLSDMDSQQGNKNLQVLQEKICLRLFGKFTFRQVPVHSNKVGKVGFVVVNGLHNQTTPKHAKTTNRQHIFLSDILQTHNKATSTSSSAQRKRSASDFLVSSRSGKCQSTRTK